VPDHADLFLQLADVDPVPGPERDDAVDQLGVVVELLVQEQRRLEQRIEASAWIPDQRVQVRKCGAVDPAASGSPWRP
jgi:hypothetical protein